ncbi:phytoene synthase [Medicago truncatula]|uniref:Phytoene synthase n=1 Tax=Medicago truncatula TaxID=3880 RepID=G7IWL0_MEDTR|nr:phytoene synthase [Medicago truncatula]
MEKLDVRMVVLTAQLQLGLFYPGGSVVDSLSCTILGSATKRLKESDLVVTRPSNNFGR